MKYHAMNKNIFQEVILSEKSYHFTFRSKIVIYNSEVSFTDKIIVNTLFLYIFKNT